MMTVTENRSDVGATAVTPSPSASKTKKVLLALALLLLLVIAVFAATPPLVMGGLVNQHVAFSQTWIGAEHGLTPNRLELTTGDGYQIVAYEVTAVQPKAIIIFLSGIHNPSVTAFFGHARMLLDEGYASILLEMRAHGESEGKVIALGYEE